MWGFFKVCVSVMHVCFTHTCVHNVMYIDFVQRSCSKSCDVSSE